MVAWPIPIATDVSMQSDCEASQPFTRLAVRWLFSSSHDNDKIIGIVAIMCAPFRDHPD
jgi:hypothetical protein